MARQKVEASRVAVEKVVYAAGFVELVGACAAYVAATGWIVRSSRSWSSSAPEQASMVGQRAKVRAADRIEHEVELGDLELGEGFAELLRGP